MDRCWKAVRTIVLLSLAALTLVALSACDGDDGGDPKDILARATAAMERVDGFHFVYTVHKPASAEPSKGLEIARITGDVNLEGSMQAVIDVTQAGIPLQLEFVVVGDTQYIQDPLSQKWTSVAVENSPVGELNLGRGVVGVLKQIRNASCTGRQTTQGAECHHITGMTAAADVKAIAGMVSTTDDFPTDIWVGVADSCVYKVEIAGPAIKNEPEAIRRSIELSDLGQYIEIKAPQ
jgi:hypothetical protein